MTMELDALMVHLENGEIPEAIQSMEDYMPMSGNDQLDDQYISDTWKMKGKIQNHYGMWAMVDKSWTKKLAEWIGDRYILEVMSGYGWLAKALSQHGCKIVATDSCESHRARIKPVFPVEKLHAVDAIRKHRQTEVLVMSWPPYRTSGAYQAAEAWGTVKPIVYIGEGYGGCTADDEFHERFAVSIEWNMPNLPYVHSRIYMGRWT